jgi:uncharacterized LabA/DUF88 family protein
MAGKIIGVFVDVSNIFYCVGKKFNGRKLDYEKYLEVAVGQDDILYRAIAFGIQVESEATKFITCLRHLGFEAKYKRPRVIQTSESDRREYRRISWNVGLALDIVRIVSNNKLDTVVIGSSDPELLHLVEWVKERGIRCEILACGISKELKDCADIWKEIGEDLLEQPITNQTNNEIKIDVNPNPTEYF